MALKFLLINKRLGSLLIERADPIDINALTKTVKRSAEFNGVVYQVMFDVEFIKEGRRFIKMAYDTDGGIDALVTVNIYDYNPNTRRWRLYSTGKVNYNRYDLGEVDVVVNIEQSGIDRKVLNMMEVDVDLDTDVSANNTELPEQSSHQITYHSKTILKEAKLTPVNNAEVIEADVITFTFPGIPTTVNIDGITYGQFDFSKREFDEIEDTFDTPSRFQLQDDPLVNQEIPGAGSEAEYIEYLSKEEWKANRNPIIQAKEKGVTDIDLALKYKFRVKAVNTGGDVDINGSGCLGNVEVTAWFEHRNKKDEILTLEQIGSWDMSNVVADEAISAFETKVYQNLGIDVEIGDKLYIYPIVRVYGGYQTHLGGTAIVANTIRMTPDADGTRISIKQQSTFEETEVKTILIFEAIERCLQFATGQVDVLRSNLIGRTDLGYDEDGQLSLIGITSGNWLRGRDGDLTPFNIHGVVNNDFVIGKKQLFSNLKQLLGFLNAIEPIGFGFEIENGKTVFRIEKLAEFYKTNTRTVSLGKVYDIRKRLDPGRYYNQVKFGYNTKIDVQENNAIDEFNTLRTGLIPVENSKNVLSIFSDIVTSGYLLETQRRLTGKTKDGRNDENNFAVVLMREDGGYRPKRDDGYEEINGVFDAPSGYNYDISPGRIMKYSAWRRVIASSLVFSTNKTVKFSSGTGNYRMSTRKTGETDLVYEDGLIDLTNETPIWVNEIYSFGNHRFTRDQMALLEANPYGYFEFQDQFNETFKGFLNHDNGIEHDSNKRVAEFDLLRVFEP